MSSAGARPVPSMSWPANRSSQKASSTSAGGFDRKSRSAVQLKRAPLLGSSTMTPATVRTAATRG